MKKSLHKALSFFKERKITTGIIVLVIVGAIFAFGGNENGKLETISVQSQDLIRTVKIAGKVVPEERVDLGFEIPGIVASVSKPVGSEVSSGQVLARLDSGSISANLAKANAELASAEAELNKLEGTEIYENGIDSAKRSLTQVILNAYTTSSSVVADKTDQFFSSPRGANPKFLPLTESYGSLRDSVGDEREQIGYMLNDWKELVSGLGTISIYTEDQLRLSKEYLDQTITFVSNVLRIVNAFSPNSQLTQSEVDTYKSTMLSARDSLSAIAQDFIDKENALTTLLSDVPVQVARVEAANAAVENLRYELGKTSLVSPISGIVAKQDAKVGQSVLAGTNLVSVISREYVIETFVPEVSIVGIKIGDTASVTLDAYGSGTVFEARVDSIDPAETIRDGVSTYKTTLTFVSRDDRIRSGMTSNVEIETFRKAGTAIIPDRTVFKEEDGAYVYILNGDKLEKREVTLGERDSRGNVEVVSGLSTTDQIVVNPPKEN